MKTLTLLTSLTTLVAASLLAASAHADVEAPASSSSRDGTEWFAHAGGVGGPGYGGLMTGVTLLGRTDSIAYGGTLEGSVGFATRVALAATGGYSVRTPSGWGFDLLGAAGVHRYDGVGSGILSDDPGTSATLPFAGVRARGVYLFGKGPRHFQLGFAASVDRDLSRVTHTYTYRETSWWDGSTSTESATHTVGFTTLGAMIDLGMTFDSF